MLNIPQYPTYASLPSGSHGDLALVTTGGVGVYQFIGQVNNEPVGLWLPSELAGRLIDYVRTRLGIDTFEIVDGGSSYSVSDTLNPSGGTADGTNAHEAILTVDSIGGGGAITAATLTNRGTYQSLPTPLGSNAPTGGTGTGALFNFVAQSLGYPAKISVGIDSVLVVDLMALGWVTTLGGAGVTPADIAGAIELDSGPTTNGWSNISLPGLEDLGITAQEYFFVLQADTSASVGGACVSQIHDSWALRRATHGYRLSGTENVPHFTRLSTVWDLDGRAQTSEAAAAFEIVFGRFTLAPNPIEVNAEIGQIWLSSTGRKKETANILLEEMWATSEGSELDIFAWTQASQRAIWKIREYHLFKLS